MVNRTWAAKNRATLDKVLAVDNKSMAWFLDPKNRAEAIAIMGQYSKMKPDAAANQITTMDELTAAAIISKLSPKASSLVLAEMDATKAARLTATIAGAAEIATKLEAMANAQHQ